MVILGHQFEKTGLGTPLQVIQTFHMPMFFIISGFFISDKSTLREFSVKRIKRLLIPYVISCFIVAILCTLVVLLKEHSATIAVKELLKRIWISIYGSGSGHGSMMGPFGTQAEIGMMWYLLALLWSSIVVKAISKNKMAGFIALMISSLAIGSTIIYGWIPFSIQNGLGAVMWVWLGYCIKKKDMLPEVLKLIYSPWIALIIIVWLTSAVYGCIHLYGNYYSLGIVDVTGAIAGCLIVFGICAFLDKKTIWIKKVLSWIGMNSLLIYCLHFLEHNVRPVSKELMDAGLTDKLQIAVLSWCIISIGTCLIAFALVKIPLVKKIYG